MMEVIKKPILTEKSTAYSQYDTYVFEVTKSATKTQVREAIENAFDVKVTNVRTVVFRTRWLKKAARFGPPKYKKKAFVKLAAGQTISIFEGA